MESLQETYLVVGSGVFGASGALFLKRSKPWGKVIVVDSVPYPNPAGASHDLNKIIRANYHELFYMKLALEAQEVWRTDPIFAPAYHECGMCFTDRGGWTSPCFENYKSIGIETGGEIISLEEARLRDPVYKNAD